MIESHSPPLCLAPHADAWRKLTSGFIPPDAAASRGGLWDGIYHGSLASSRGVWAPGVPGVPGSRDPGVPGSGGPRFPRPRNRIRLGRSLGRPVRRSITPSIARPITRSIARCTRPFDPGVGTLTPKPKASEGGEKGKHLMGATRGGTPEGKETSACLVSYLSRCTRPFDPGVGTPTPKPEASEGGENGNILL